MAGDKKIKSKDMRLIDELFEMEGGYVLDFSNRTFADFFIDEFGINIDDPVFEVDGTSKAKRLRFYLRNARTEDALKTLLALWDYREASRRRAGKMEKLPEHKVEFFHLIERLGGKAQQDIEANLKQSEKDILNEEIANNLLNILIDLSSLEPQTRGYEFEKFLNLLFNENGMEGRASFRLTGEQIDGSFQLDKEIYLLEAKWQNNPVGVSDLRSFNAKVEDKASWSRGLFVSYSGFSEDGLDAFGKGKSVVCMDGLDLNDMLENRLLLKDVLSKKVRRAAEMGQPFVRIRDLL